MNARTILPGVAGLSTGILVGVIFGFPLNDRDIPVSVVEETAINYLIKPGETARIRFHFLRAKSCYTRADANWKDSHGKRTPIKPRDWATGLLPLGEDVATVEEDAPIDASEGPLSYTTVNSYGCNWISRWLWPVVAAPRVVNFWVER